MKILNFLFILLLCLNALYAFSQDGLPANTYRYVNKGKKITETIRVVITEKNEKTTMQYFYSSTTFKEKPLVLMKEVASKTETYPAGVGKMPIILRTFQFANNPTPFTFKCERERLLRVNPDKSISPFVLQYE